MKRKSFWSIKETTTTVSWMWHKLLKLRDKAKDLQRMKIGDGRKASFWYDSWSTMGRLYDLFGSRGCIDMGIPSESTVAMVMTTQRRRRHRADILNEVETIIEDQRSKLLNEDDISLWKQPDGK